MECLERVRLMAPKLPAPLQGANWTRRQMCFAKRCPHYWKATTGTQFKEQINLVVAELGTHYKRHAEVLAARTHLDTEKLKLHQKKHNYANAWAEYVQSLEKWIPRPTTKCEV